MELTSLCLSVGTIIDRTCRIQFLFVSREWSSLCCVTNLGLALTGRVKQEIQLEY